MASRQERVSRQRRWQLKQQAKGKCVKCNSPRINKTHCLRHAVYERERQRRKLGCIQEYETPLRQAERTFKPPPLSGLAKE